MEKVNERLFPFPSSPSKNQQTSPTLEITDWERLARLDHRNHRIRHQHSIPSSSYIVSVGQAPPPLPPPPPPELFPSAFISR
ncbi:hypothetical protein E2C01_076629 [Portunus trituberculatus]|uniref:Uncharacterized protein n=1 Tax=Portunus trituberculatus TaxID=210409 RepID=A0A5B7IK75_PORTR|nr:hypothetical protein [Portunus trituberculatus]